MLVDAASLRQGLILFAESGRRSRHRSPKPNIARGIVRAVCVYRHEQGLKGPRFDWGPYNAKGKRGLGRYATRPIPQTPVARLIAAVVDGLELNIPNSTLKTELSRYGRLVNQAGRDPEYVDLLCGGEGQSPDTQLR